MASPPEACYIDVFFDLSLCVPVVINMLKSQIGGVKGGWQSWDWDPFHLMHMPAGFTWNSVFWLLLTVAAFSFISIEVHIRHRAVKDFSIPISASLMGSLIFPQKFFWYTYPILIFTSFWSSWIANIMGWLRGIASAAPIWNITISATHQPPQTEVGHVDERHPQEEQQNVEDGSLEAIGADEQV